MIYNKYTGAVRTLAFASFNYAILSDPVLGGIRKTVDYSKIRLSQDRAFRNQLADRLGAIGLFVEDVLGSPQNIEGLVSEDIIYLVQTRSVQNGA